MQEQPVKKYSIMDLAEKTNLNKRTVRYYIHREMLPPPFGSKKGSYYTDMHLERLLLICKLSSQGVPLHMIKQTLADKDQTVSDPQAWKESVMFEGVRLSFLPNVLTRSDVADIHNFINELMLDKGRPESNWRLRKKKSEENQVANSE